MFNLVIGIRISRVFRWRSCDARGIANVQVTYRAPKELKTTVVVTVLPFKQELGDMFAKMMLTY